MRRGHPSRGAARMREKLRRLHGDIPPRRSALRTACSTAMLAGESLRAWRRLRWLRPPLGVWVAKSQYERVRQCGAVLLALATVVRFIACPTTSLGVLVKPATLLKFHKALAERKYWLLFSFLASPQARSERTLPRAHRGHRRNEAAQSAFRLRAHCSADSSCLRHRDRQGCRSPRAREALPARRLRNQWPLLADIRRAGQGQPVERRSVPL